MLFQNLGIMRSSDGCVEASGRKSPWRERLVVPALLTECSRS